MTPALLESAFMCFVLPAERLMSISLRTDERCEPKLSHAKAPESSMKTLCRIYVAKNLGAQRIGVFKAPLRPDECEKTNFDSRRRVAGWRVEQEGLNGQGMPVERGAVPDIRNGLPLLAGGFIARARHIHAIAGQQFVFRGQIQSGDSLLRPDTLAFDDHAFQCERRSHQPACARYASGGNQASDARAADAFPLAGYGRHGLQIEAESFAQGPQRIDIAGLPEAKSEILSHQHAAGFQNPDEDPLDELFRSQSRKFQGERKQESGLDAFGFEPPQALRNRGDQLGRAVRRKHARGMRIERENRGDEAAVPRNFGHPPHNLTVSDMHAVEIADGDYRRAKIRRHFGGRSKYLHTRSATSISSPSQARKIPAGRDASVAACGRS